MTSPIINLSDLEPLYQPHKMPKFHRIRAKREGDDIKTAREGLVRWVQGLYKVYFAHH